MSYLQFPRLIFSGKFQADPSTVNNDPEHFNTARFQPNYDEFGQGASNGWWNPKGTGAWRFKDCVVTQVEYLDGSVCDDPNLDPVVGMPINSVVDRVEGKLVDLDPEQQMVSAIWGFQVYLGAKSSEIGFGGDYAVASFGDIWVRYPKGSPDSFFGAYYQSVIQLKKGITGAPSSRYLQELQTATGTGNELSIKFNVDGYVDDNTQVDFTFGRVTGAIGAQQAAEPRQFVSGRTIFATPGTSPGLNTAYATVQNNFLHLDLGNSLPTTSAGGPLQSFGNLMLATEDSAGNTVFLGTVPYAGNDWYGRTAGIVSFPLTPANKTLVGNHPLSLVQPGSGGNTAFASESANGQYVRADQFVFRFNPTETNMATLYATKFGKPMPNATISFQMDSSNMVGQQTQGPLAGPPAGIPTSAVTFPGALTNPKGGFQVKTLSNGIATISIQATNPGNPRGYIDGQVYGVAYQLGPVAPAVGAIQNPSQILNLLVFSGYAIPDQPTWIEDVQPIFQQYADLYPVMKRIVDLGNYGSVMKHRSILKNVFSTPESDPNYMPVTRDLSKPKREMLLRWLDNPAYMNLDSVPQLMQALQTAIELEHSTIPPYLTAMYSIIPGQNTEVASLIRGVVIEEMLHMSLACNILISIGGSPSIGQPGFIPTYPGGLPGGLRNGLTVNLKRCSIEQIRDCFMQIEMPEELLLQRMRRMDPNLDAKMRANALSNSPNMEYAEYTIGWFYDQIKAALTNLSDSGQITFGNADKQVSEWSGLGKLYVINSLQDALNAIDEIKDQGEGTDAKDPMDGDGELAHYYKYSEIVEGRQLIQTPAGGWAYTGPQIPFDPAGVYPMIDNPSLVAYPEGSRAALLSQMFAESYQALLLSLHDTFNGNPTNLRASIGAMYSMGLQAVELMQTPTGLNDGLNAGPKFKVNYEQM